MAHFSSKENSAKKVLGISFLVDISDVLLSLLVAITSGSVVMLSQVLEGLADLISSGLLLFGLSQSRKKADFTHPFGYGRELYFWTLISALIMLTVTSTLTFHFGLDRFLHPKPIKNIYFAFAVLVIGTISNTYALSLSAKRISKGKGITKFWKTFWNSSFIETKSALVLDLIGTLASIFGLIALTTYQLTDNGQFDGLGAMVIGTTMAFLSIILLVTVKDFLIGRGVSIQTIETIKNATKRVEHINSIQDLKATHIGPEGILINIEINAKDNLSTNQLERLIDNVKESIQKDLPSARQIQVELES